MGMAGMLWLGAGIVAALYAIALYNRLVSLTHGVDKAWSNIDVLLKQRHDELPKLVEVCKRHAQFEQDTLQRVIAARNQVQTAREQQNIAALGRAETGLRQGLGQLFAVAEAYPELRADQAFAQLQSRISQLENAIADRREFYNEAVNLLNVGLDQFPNNLIAQRFGFQRKPVLTFTAEQTADVDIRALFG